MSKESTTQTPYRVLARKYRPQSFEELIGQDALVRTLKNAIESGRIAHAFMLTGVRGVGKTTTARIIAKALNYKGADGHSGPTTGSTQDCTLCQAISEDRHPDVIEMDAASRTGVEDIREILDGVRYAPTEARYKVYIIDEVHMLSKQAFNALLKTLEEPPEHVKFIFATTEIRKVPITVLSRCQRFDLRRVDVPTLMAHFTRICKAEKVETTTEALTLIAQAADGSVRDGLSLLDQAIALGADKVEAAQVQDMLGLGDRTQTLRLLENILQGNSPEALSIMDDLYKAGADPLVLVQDMLHLIHLLTRTKAAPNTQGSGDALTTETRAKLDELAGKLSMPTLGRSWQILLKGLGEVQNAPNPQTAAEMVVIRLIYAADLPDPSDLIKKLKDTPQGTPTGAAPPPPPPGGGARESAALSVAVSNPGPLAVAQPEPQTQTVRALDKLEDIIALLEEGGEFILAGQVRQYVHLVKIQDGLLEFRPAEHAPQKLAADLKKSLTTLSGRNWVISLTNQGGALTLAERDQAHNDAEREEVLNTPIIKSVFETFPGAELIDIVPRETI